ncbi:2061_t:CDS:1, partial [Racocetra persica]
TRYKVDYEIDEEENTVEENTYHTDEEHINYLVEPKEIKINNLEDTSSSEDEEDKIDEINKKNEIR